MTIILLKQKQRKKISTNHLSVRARKSLNKRDLGLPVWDPSNCFLYNLQIVGKIFLFFSSSIFIIIGSFQELFTRIIDNG